MTLRFSGPAQADLEEIWLYLLLESGNKTVADRWIDRILEKARAVSTDPHIGRLRPDLGVDLRSVVIGKYLVIYAERTLSVEIVRVIHGSRDLAKIFP